MKKCYFCTEFMKLLLNYRINHVLATLLLLCVSLFASAAEKTVAELEGEDKAMYDRFRHLFVNGSPEEFYSFAKEYEQDLLSKKYMMIYYKLKNNEGFYAVRHNQLFKAMQYARELEKEVHEAGAVDYYYLPTGLMGDIYNACHNTHKAEAYFTKALDEVGDRDVKYTMRMYLNMAEMLCLKDSESSLQWLDKSLRKAREVENVDYESMTLALMCYVHFLKGDAEAFYRANEDYERLRRTGHPDFNSRYDNMVDVARLSFDGDYYHAFEKLKRGGLSVDSSLVAIRVYAMKGDVVEGFQAMKRRYSEMDSIYSMAQDASFDQMASESALMHTQQEAAASKQKASRLTNWLIGLTLLFVIIYVMGRRRLMLKIWARNKELKEALAKAEESDRMKSAFISSMSHEIRTPLNAVAGFSSLICSPDYELSAQERQDMQARITSNVNQITTIINEMLELSKSESEGEMAEAEKTDVRINELCRNVMQSMDGRQKDGVEMRFTSNVDGTFAIRSGDYRLRSTLKHLLDNAQKFTDEGHIEVCCLKEGSHFEISVADTGVGINEKDYERIFETFTKIDDFKEGIGLGLPICRRLITSLGGTIRLDHNYHQGSRFVITLPCVG